MSERLALFGKGIVTAFAVAAILASARDLGATETLDCQYDPPNGLYGVCTSQGECQLLCLNHPGSITFCGACCECLL